MLPRKFFRVIPGSVLPDCPLPCTYSYAPLCTRCRWRRLSSPAACHACWYAGWQSCPRLFRGARPGQSTRSIRAGESQMLQLGHAGWAGPEPALPAAAPLQQGIETQGSKGSWTMASGMRERRPWQSTEAPVVFTNWFPDSKSTLPTTAYSSCLCISLKAMIKKQQNSLWIKDCHPQKDTERKLKLLGGSLQVSASVADLPPKHLCVWRNHRNWHNLCFHWIRASLKTLWIHRPG